ncbi:MAG: SUMF1/EgtB/PvdO family nonheme iron enzyme [Verrucomicrobiae bacterium]
MGEPLRFQHFEVYQDPDGRPLELGRGGMGVTYKAFDVNLGRDVALKVISPQLVSGEEARQRFLREARTAASFRHPHVASVYHLGEVEGSCFYAMEFVEGETLEAFRQREGNLPAATSLEIMDQVADALGAAGQLGLVHRDIKPANIMLHTDFNRRLSAKLIDFGLAKSFERQEGDSSATLTMAGFVGTPAYASPEQLENQPLDARTDIYSLGVTFFYMLCGRPPFSGSLASVISQHLTRPLPISELAGQPREIVQLVVEMTAKPREDRPKDAGELRRRIAMCREAAGPAGRAREPESAAAEGQHWLNPFFSGKHEGIASDSRNRRGRSFEAAMPGGGEAEVLFLYRDWTSDPAAFAGFEGAVQKLNKNCPPAFRKVLSVETSGDQTAAVCETVEGIPLLEVLKARKSLRPPEAIAVLRPIAAALDLAIGMDLACPDLTLHDIWLTPAAPANTDLADWPQLAVRVDALAFLHQQAFGGDGTMIPGLSQKPAESAGLQAEYLGLTASLACELLGSPRRNASDAAFTPLPSLSANGNSVLQRALALDPTFGSLENFIWKLESEEGGSQRCPKHQAAPPALPEERQQDGNLSAFPWRLAGALAAILGLAGILFIIVSSLNGPRAQADRSEQKLPPATQAVASSPAGPPVSPGAKATPPPQPTPDAASSQSQPPAPAENSLAEAAKASDASKKATKDAPFENSLGMRFVPMPGTDALMSVWDTRVRDFRAYAQATGYRQQGGIYVLNPVKTKDGKGYSLNFEFDAGASWEKPGFPQTASHPVVSVSWDEAKAFCRWLTAKEREEGKIGKDQEYRLPTDEEWSEAVGETRYPWGNQWPPPANAGNYMDDALVSKLPANAWTRVPGNDGYAYTSPVGTYQPNRLGLYDMGGNVWQWCEDWYRAGMNERAVLERIPGLKDDGGGKKFRSLRGGSWNFGFPEVLLSSFRGHDPPGFRNSLYGFRCVLSGGSSR